MMMYRKDFEEMSADEKQQKISELQNAVYGDTAGEIRRGEEFSRQQNENMEKALKVTGF